MAHGVFMAMCENLGVQPTIDLFASQRHKQLPGYYTADKHDRKALGHNAFAYFWERDKMLYANPPWSLIPQVLEKIRKEHSRVLLITPKWKYAPWYEDLLAITVRSYEYGVTRYTCQRKANSGPDPHGPRCSQWWMVA